MEDREARKNLPLHITKGDFDPRLADWIERVEIHDIVSAEVDSSPYCGTPDSVDKGARDEETNAEDYERPSKREIPPPSTKKYRGAEHKTRASNGRVDEPKEAGIQECLYGNGC